MQIKTYTSFLFALLILITTACNDDDAPTNPPPTITITSPTEDQITAGFTQGDDVVIAGTVEDNSLVSTITTKVFYNGIDTGEGETLQVGQKTASINQTVSTTGAPAGDYRFLITATDDQGATATWDRTITLRP